MLVDHGQQRVEVVGDPDRHTGRHTVDDRTEALPERLAGRPELGVEHGHLDRRLRHRVSLEHGQMAGHVGRRQSADAEQLGGDEVFDHVLGAVDVLG